jgi:hypothetical protein
MKFADHMPFGMISHLTTKARRHTKLPLFSPDKYPILSYPYYHPVLPY